jgi:hypothetical protein
LYMAILPDVFAFWFRCPYYAQSTLDRQSLVLCLVFGGRSTGLGSQFSTQRRFQLWLSRYPQLRRLMLYPTELQASRIKLLLSCSRRIRLCCRLAPLQSPERCSPKPAI